MTTNYRFTLKGTAGATVRDAFSDLDIEVQGDQTVLRAELVDQAALEGVLDRILALGIEIVEIRSGPIG